MTNQNQNGNQNGDNDVSEVEYTIYLQLIVISNNIQNGAVTKVRHFLFTLK